VTEAARTSAARRSVVAGRRPRLWWWREVLYVLAFYAVYSFIRNKGVATDSEVEAFQNAKEVIRAERLLGAYVEEGVQDWFLDWESFIRLWNIFYGTAHFVVTAGALVFLFRRASAVVQARVLRHSG
jgi:hypothetical protein